METIKYITEDQIAGQVYLAIDDDKYLPIDQPVSLEYLTDQDDGIFPNIRSWRGFLYGNFGTGDGSIWLTGELKETTVKRWCYPLDQNMDRFAVQVAKDRWLPVPAGDLKFKFTYDANNFKRGSDSNLPCVVEFYVTATIEG